MIFSRRQQLEPTNTPTDTMPARRGASHGVVFKVSSRIAQSAGSSGRYASDKVRALPTPDGERVILQATDGHQAVCVVEPGHMAKGSVLVPTQVLPTRKPAQAVTVRLERDHWESSEGKLAPAVEEGSFPPIGDVLSDVSTSTSSASNPLNGNGHTGTHIALALDAEFLRKQALALGTTKLTLLIPLPVKSHPGKTSSEQELPVVERPVCVCPATAEAGVEGIGVVMPLKPERSATYYRQLRQLVVESERLLSPKTRTRGRAQPSRDLHHANQN
ncbi:MAG: hypothetical protein GC164_16110 [Phycisphaera sp.]|nr:hypothetical protein [Phycisphaera sp.]